MRTNFQNNGTPIRSGTKIVREAIEKSYNEVVVSAHSVESKMDDITSKIDQFRVHNAAIANYCLVHPATAVFGSASVVAIPSYLGECRFPPPEKCRDLMIGFGMRGMMLGAIGTASFTTLFIGSLLYAQRRGHITRSS